MAGSGPFPNSSPWGSDADTTRKSMSSDQPRDTAAERVERLCTELLTCGANVTELMATLRDLRSAVQAKDAEIAKLKEKLVDANKVAAQATGAALRAERERDEARDMYDANHG